MFKLLWLGMVVSAVLLACDSSTDNNAHEQFKAPEDLVVIPSSAIQTKTGLAYRILRAAPSGQTPSRFSEVVVHYSGWTADGRLFDSSLKRGSPSTFKVDQAIPGWVEVLSLMTVGQRVRVWVPENLAYKGQAGMPKGRLVYDLELIEIKSDVTPNQNLNANPMTAKSSDPQTTTLDENAEKSARGEPMTPHALGRTPNPAQPARKGEDVVREPINVPSPGATRTATGLASEVIRPGHGQKHPTDRSLVLIHYRAWKGDWVEFESSYRSGGPAYLPVDGVIKGLSEGIKLMVEGEQRRFWIPDELAYKNQPRGSLGPVVFEVELIKIEMQPSLPPAPSTVAEPPKDAERTDSGLRHQKLNSGSGSTKPKASSVVRVHYTGWTTDGKVFDSSIVRKTPAQFSLEQVIPGWSEGLQLMVVGEKRRLWIPEELAYRGLPNRPSGTLVFDVELLEILGPKGGSAEIDEKAPLKRGLMGDFNPQTPPPGFKECHDLHCHHENGKVVSYRDVMNRMGTETNVEKKRFDPTKPPSDVATVPKNAERTASGLAHRLLRNSKDSRLESPEIDAIVRFHFSGWTQAGVSFLSSLMAGRDVEMPLASLPSPGLQEAFQLMKVGEKRRFWIPESITGSAEGMQVPKGDLVFDIELIDFK